jgi:AP-1 complex subunit mu
MAVSYVEAIELLAKDASERLSTFPVKGEVLPVSQAIGRVSWQTYSSLIESPQVDTAATLGYAVNSGYTQLASIDKTAIFRVLDHVPDEYAEDLLVNIRTTTLLLV